MTEYYEKERNRIITPQKKDQPNNNISVGYRNRLPNIKSCSLSDCRRCPIRHSSCTPDIIANNPISLSGLASNTKQKSAKNRLLTPSIPTKKLFIFRCLYFLQAGLYICFRIYGFFHHSGLNLKTRCVFFLRL